MKKKILLVFSLLTILLLAVGCSSGKDTTEEDGGQKFELNKSISPVEFAQQCNGYLDEGVPGLIVSEGYTLINEGSRQQRLIQITDFIRIELVSYEDNGKLRSFTVAVSPEGKDDPATIKLMEQYMVAGTRVIAKNNTDEILSKINFPVDTDGTLESIESATYENNKVEFFYQDFIDFDYGELICGFLFRLN